MENTRTRSADFAETFLMSSGCFLTAYLANHFLSLHSGLPVIWLADGIFLALLLRIEGRNLIWNSTAFFCVLVIAEMAAGKAVMETLTFSIFHLFQSLLAFALLGNLYGRIPILEKLGQVLGVILFASLVPAGAGAFALSGYGYFLLQDDAISLWQGWWLANALGFLVTIPPILSWKPSQPHLRDSPLEIGRMHCPSRPVLDHDHLGLFTILPHQSLFDDPADAFHGNPAVALCPCDSLLALYNSGLVPQPVWLRCLWGAAGRHQSGRDGPAARIFSWRHLSGHIDCCRHRQGAARCRISAAHPRKAAG